MKVTLEKKEKNQVHLEVEVELNRVKKAVEGAYRQVSQQVNIPGFRKGKAPRQLVERTVGLEYIRNEALEKLVPECLEEAVAEQNLEVIDRPGIEVVRYETGEALIFKATVPVRPEVAFTSSYTEISAQAPKTELDPAAVDERLVQMREQKASFVTVDRAIEMNDHAVIDFAGKLQGADAPFPGGTAEDFDAEVAPGRFIDGFVENLVGMKAGDEKDFDVTFPAEYQSAELAGKPATFHVAVKSVQGKQVPELDDAFVESLGLEAKTVSELRENVTKEMTEEADDNRELLLRQQILDQVLEKADVELPESMIQREVQFLMNQYAQMMQAQGLDVRSMFGGDRLKDWAGSLRPEAEKRIKTSLTLGTIAKANGLTITEEEVDEEIVEYAAMYKVDPAAVRNQLIQTGGWTTLADEVLSNKILDWLREQAQVTEGPIPEKYAPKPEGAGDAGVIEAEVIAPEAEAVGSDAPSA